jgi:uncharacterized protein (TIGR03437 family)
MRYLLPALLTSVLAAQEPDLRAVQIAGGINAPTDIQNAGDGSGRLFLVEQAGLIRILRNGSLLSQPFLDIRNRTKIDSERGLLGLAFPPGFAQKQRFYVNYTDLNGDTVVAMYRVSANPDLADAASETILLPIRQPFPNHNGGQVRFGPDGYLYIGMGDGGGAGDPNGNGQNPASLLGKLLRIDVESEPGRYRVPPDNPFVNTSGARPEIWAVGLRNPWRFSFDRANSDLYIADVGQDTWEEVDYAPASSRGGENYGWNAMEGLVCYRSGCNMSGLSLPVAVYSHNGGDCSVTGGFVYRGLLSPGLRGAYLYGDYCTGRIRTLRREGQQWIGGVALRVSGQLTTFGEDEAGEIYVAASGNILRIEGSRAPRLVAAGIVNAATFAPGLVAGSLATIFAAGSVDTPGVISAPSLPLLATLSGVSITVNGIAAPIHSLANTNGVEQVNFQVPFEAAGRSTVTVAVSRAGATSFSVDAPLLNVQPGVFAQVVHNADYTLVTPERPLAPNEFAFAYAVGLGRVSNQPRTGAAAAVSPLSFAQEDIRVTLAGLPCEVQFAGLAPNFAGVYQVNFRVPATVPSGAQDLVISAGGSSSPPVKTQIR